MRGRAAAAVAWSIAAFAALCAVAGIALSAIAAASSGDNPEVRQFAAIPVGMLAYVVIGAVVAARRPGNPIGWILLAIGLTWELFVFGTGYAGYATFVTPGRLPAVAALALGTGDAWLVSGSLIGALFMLVPEGRSLSSRWRAAMWLMLALITGQVVLRALGTAIPNRTYLRNPLGFAAADPFAASAANVVDTFWPAFFVLAAAAVVVRFRRSRGVERKQLEWIAAGAVFEVGATVALQVITVSPLHALDPGARFAAELFAGVPFALGFTVLPIAVGVAVLRHGLYDIDLIIRRTLVYGALSAVLAATYFVAVLVFETVLRPVTSGSEVAVALSTLAVVALFAPVRSALQRFIDRRLYRSRYHAERTLDAFSARLLDEVDLDAVRRDLLATASSTMQPAHASVWLRERGR